MYLIYTRCQPKLNFSIKPNFHLAENAITQTQNVNEKFVRQSPLNVCRQKFSGCGTVLEDTRSHLPADLFICPIKNVIAGPLNVKPLKGSSKFNLSDYEELVMHFNTVSCVDR